MRLRRQALGGGRAVGPNWHAVPGHGSVSAPAGAQDIGLYGGG